MVERIRFLCHEGLDDEEIARQLTTEGFRTARSLSVSPKAVLKIRGRYGLHLVHHQIRDMMEFRGRLTVRGLADRLGVGTTWVYNHIYDGTIAPSYVTQHPKGKFYLIQNDPKLLDQLQEHRKHNTQGGI